MSLLGVDKGVATRKGGVKDSGFEIKVVKVRYVSGNGVPKRGDGKGSTGEEGSLHFLIDLRTYLSLLPSHSACHS